MGFNVGDVVRLVGPKGQRSSRTYEVVTNRGPGKTVGGCIVRVAGSDHGGIWYPDSLLALDDPVDSAELSEFVKSAIGADPAFERELLLGELEDRIVSEIRGDIPGNTAVKIASALAPVIQGWIEEARSNTNEPY